MIWIVAALESFFIYHLTASPRTSSGSLYHILIGSGPLRSIKQNTFRV